MKKMTAVQWLSTPKYIHIVIADPDGWRHKGMKWEDEITQQEFEKRMNESTVLIRKDKTP